MIHHESAQDSGPLRPRAPAPTTLYLRKIDKNGLKITLMTPIMLHELQRAVLEKLCIPIQRQVLYVKGKRFHLSPDELLQIPENTIVHVYQKVPQNSETLSIEVQIYNQEKKLLQPRTFVVNRDDRIDKFLEEKLAVTNAIFVESGRIIDLKSTFRQQDVHDGVTITCKLRVDPIQKTNQIQKDLMMLFDDEDDSDFNAVQEIQNIQPKGYVRVFKDPSTIFQEEIAELKSDFKKKKAACFKAIHYNPEDRAYSWQKIQDRSTSLSKLAKNLKCKKRSQAAKPVIPKQKLTSSARMKLRQEFQRLFQSDSVLRKSSSCGEIADKPLAESNQTPLSRGDMKYELQPNFA